MQCIDGIAESLKREGVSKLFCYPTNPLIETAVARGITPVISR